MKQYTLRTTSTIILVFVSSTLFLGTIRLETQRLPSTTTTTRIHFSLANGATDCYLDSSDENSAEVVGNVACGVVNRNSSLRCKPVQSTNSSKQTQGAQPLEPKLTIAILYYANPSMLIRQLDTYSGFAQRIREKLEILIVDDGSPNHLQARHWIEPYHRDKFALVRLATILENIPWNTPQARNLAFYLAGAEKVMMIDSDLVALEATIDAVFTLPTSFEFESGKGFLAYSLYRRLPNGKKYTFHPSALVTEPGAWWSAGGCDEDFSGNYGHEDILFYHRFTNVPGNQRITNESIIVHQIDGGPCEWVTNVTRKSLCNSSLDDLPRVPKDSSLNLVKRRNKFRTNCRSNVYLRYPWIVEDLTEVQCESGIIGIKGMCG